MESLNLHFRKFGGLWHLSCGCKGYRVLPDFGKFLSENFKETTTLLVSLTDHPKDTTVFKCTTEEGQFGKYNHRVKFYDISSKSLISSEIQCQSIEELGIDKEFYFNVEEKK